MAAPVPVSYASIVRGAPDRAPPKLSLKSKIQNAHQDDIHGFLGLEGHFVSGSKDTSIKAWDHQGNFLKEFIPKSLQQKNYKYWVTALGKFSNGSWASGSRDGYIAVWNANGDEVCEYRYNPDNVVRKTTIAKARNIARILNITELKSEPDETQFYVGTPKYLHLWSTKTGGIIRSYNAHVNDWVYCVEKHDENNLILAIGSSLEYWDMQRVNPRKSSLIEESESDRVGVQRPHISDITCLNSNKNHLLVALFNATVRCTDINTTATIREFKEHIPMPNHSRVWSVCNLKENVFASSADDATIKVWDVRQTRSIETLKNNPGRVSDLLKIDANTFISGSAPDDVFRSRDKALITFWDMRNLRVNN